MRIVIIAMLLGMVSAGYKLAGGHARTAAPASTVEERVKLTADRINAAGPKALGDGMMMASARAEGRVMHLRMTGVPDWQGDGVSEEEMTREISAQMCDSGNTKMIDDGVTIQVEMETPGGARLPDLMIDRCPGGRADASALR